MTSRYGGFWARSWASSIDMIVISLATSVMTLVLFGIAYWIGPGAMPFADSFNPVMLQGIMFGLYCLLSLPYYIWGHYKYGTTFGKVAFRLFVVNESDEKPISFQQSLVRCVGYAISALPLNAGYLLAAFHPKKRALHDLLAGTVVVKK